MRHAQLEGRITSISASGSPGITTVAEYTNAYDGAYFLVQVADTTNNETQLSELVIVDDYVDGTGSYDVDMTEYGNVETSSGLGTFGARVSAAGTVSLVFTPNASIDTVVNVLRMLCLLMMIPLYHLQLHLLMPLSQLNLVITLELIETLRESSCLSMKQTNL